MGLPACLTRPRMTSLRQFRRLRRFSTVSNGYKGFGSFHSENVEELLAAPDSSYEPPPLPQGVRQAASGQRWGQVAFGKSMRAEAFLLDEGWGAFINHAAFGATLRPAFEASEAWRLHMERQPLRFIDRELLPALVYIVRRLAAFLQVDRQKLALVQNATSALNSIIRQLDIQQHEEILSLSVGYGSVKKMIREACSRTGARHVEAQVNYHLSDEELLDMVQQNLGPQTRYAVFDHVTSNTARILPIERLISLCQANGTKVIIDGAHGLLNQALELDRLGPDYYVGNCHKWFSACKGSGFLYVKEPKNHRALIISHGYDDGFLSSYLWDGLRDYSPALSVLTCLHFWEDVGVERSREYMQSLMRSARELLGNAWDIDLGGPLQRLGSMSLVAVPPRIFSSNKLTSAEAKNLQDHLHYKSRIEVPIKCVDGQLHARISCHIYNTLDQYEQLAYALRDLRL